MSLSYDSELDKWQGSDNDFYFPSKGLSAVTSMSFDDSLYPLSVSPTVSEFEPPMEKWLQDGQSHMADTNNQQHPYLTSRFDHSSPEVSFEINYFSSTSEIGYVRLRKLSMIRSDVCP
jgi:hypothetical protein